MISIRSGETTIPFLVTKGRFKFTLRQATTRNYIMRALESHGKMQIKDIAELTGLSVYVIRREIPRMKDDGFVKKERINDGRTGTCYEWCVA